MSASRSPDVINTVTLEAVRFYAQQHLPRHFIENIDTVELSTYFDHVSEHMVMMMRAYVLGEEGGETAEDTFAVMLPTRPRWLPKWLWRRIPTYRAEVTLTAQPKWTYPHSTIKVPELEQPVRIAVRGGGYPTHDMVGWQDNEETERLDR